MCSASTRLVTLVVLGSLLLLNPVRTAAQKTAPDSISFQGYLTDSGGVPLDTVVGMTFTLYKSGTSYWTELHPDVAVVGGVFNVLLGQTKSLDTLAFDQPMDLGIKVATDPEISPRTPLVSSSYALAMRGMYAVWAEDVPGNQSYNLVGGSANNFVDAGVVGATIGGGGGFDTGFPVPDSVLADWGTVAGGHGNAARGLVATIGGGAYNIAGVQAVVSGGSFNWSTGDGGAIGGGGANQAGGTWSVVGGGENNRAIADYATIGGGSFNLADGQWATVGGGASNLASWTGAVVPGGIGNVAGDWTTFAAGYHAKARHAGSFVWSDRSVTTGADSVETTGPNQFLIRAAGGVGIGTTNPGSHALAVVDTGDGGIATATLDVVNLSTSSGIAAHLKTSGTDASLVIDQTGTGDHIRTFDNGNLRFRITDSGNVTADGSFTGGGADLAEAFSIEGLKSAYEPGDVLVLSVSIDRTVALSEEAYSVRVAGVYATKPGVLLTDRGIEEDLDERVPLAIVGVVPTKVTAENGPIGRGDLLVTSDTRGHAMRASPLVVQGREMWPTGQILGKALEPFLGPGTGIIEVLVSLK